MNPSTDRVYVANQNDGTVSVIDGVSNAVIATIPVGAGPIIEQTGEGQPGWDPIPGSPQLLPQTTAPRLGYSELRVEFDLSAIEALAEDENRRVEREAKLLDRGVLIINEVRRQRNLPDVPWGDAPLLPQSAPERSLNGAYALRKPTLYSA